HRARIWFEAESYILQIPVTAFEIVCDKTRIEKALAGAYWDALLDACAFLRKSWKEKRDILEEEGLLHHLSQNVTAHFLRVERTTIHRAKRAK
ncbi:MAG: hypothetical protein LBN29_00380, partial [Mediterranea sp.]|nr:hypothetical protein [Mediterranea sp.]